MEKTIKSGWLREIIANAACPVVDRCRNGMSTFEDQIWDGTVAVEFRKTIDNFDSICSEENDPDAWDEMLESEIEKLKSDQQIEFVRNLAVSCYCDMIAELPIEKLSEREKNDWIKFFTERVPANDVTEKIVNELN